MKKFLFVLAFLVFIAACSEKVNPDDGGKPQDKDISVTGITLDITDVSIKAGETVVLSATIMPDNATNKSVTWSSSSSDVATVDNNGKVTGIKVGSATITVTTADGGKTATCTVTVAAPANGTDNGYEWVDLGLPSGLKWATRNVGATVPEEYGDYFAWGEVAPYYTEGHSQDSPCYNWKDGKSNGYDWLSYQLCNGTIFTLTKYNTDRTYGSVVDNLATLELANDAARTNWGGSWRMPTDTEWTELSTECTWTWSTLNGVNGVIVTGTNGSTIFLPAAGHRNYMYLDDTGSYGYYWSSSLDPDSPSNAWHTYFASDEVRRFAFARFYGRSVRPVSDEGVKVPVSGVSLDRDAIDMEEGSTATLTASVTPSNATQPAVIWSSSNTSVATVDYTGVVTAVNAGSAIITATTYDGGLYATCSVSVSISTNYEWVDLGLPSGLKWAICNVGANAPEDFGDFFAWGEIEPYYVEGHSQDNPCSAWRDGKSGYNWSSYKWCEGSQNTLTKYNIGSSYGIVDNKTKLDLEDDAARANWGGKWRMPTDEEWTELKTNCTWKWNYLNGVGGYFVSGPNGSSIFLPAAGVRGGTGHLLTSSGRYWSSSLPWNGTICALDFIFTESGAAGGLEDRNHGNSIRAVRE